ncbi:MAG: tyrosine-type recombinase/integrase [Chloroflexota bacterium]|nr:tyrosine-type recombinase/integrase [Chloroflexota bacterium]
MEGGSSVGTVTQALELFETVGMPARNLATRTRCEYARDLRDLLTYLECRGISHLEAVRPQELEGYLAELDRRGLEGSTRNRKTHTLKTFFAWLASHELLASSPAARLVPPKAIKKEPRYLSEEEYRRLLRACSHHTRDAAIIEVFLQTGMRLSELARLTLSDVELPKRITHDIESMGSVRVQRKGGKIERIPLNYKACQVLAAYLKVRPKVGHDGLFITKFKTRMTPRSIEYMVTKYLAETGIHHASVHTLRHTMATHHVMRGTDLKTVQVTLGHASLATTTIYVSLSKRAQKKALQEHAL